MGPRLCPRGQCLRAEGGAAVPDRHLPAGPLPTETAARWRVFIAGIRAHEAVHGRYVEEMAEEIYDATVGFRQQNDPGCKAIRDAIQAPLKAAYARYKAKNAAFERSEMAPGGNIHRLIADLVR